MSGYGLEKHSLRGSDRYGSSSTGGIQSARGECSTDHGDGPVRSKNSDEILSWGIAKHWQLYSLEILQNVA